MTTRVRSRLLGNADDSGVYAVLYAVLVVVLLGLAAIVVDFASVRQDRRVGRSATDSAAIGAAELLNPQAAGGTQPYQACLRAWGYLSATLQVATPPLACSAFSGVTASTYCATANPAEIDDDRTIGNRTFRVAWPIPAPAPLGSGGTGFLTPDIAPGSVTQKFNASVDGDSKGCDRIGVAMFESARFALGNVLGSSGTPTQVHSVARFNPNGGPNDEAAALNVLNPTDCNSLVVTGGGNAVVGPTTSDGTNVGPGVIAIESDGQGSCGGSAKTITLSGSGTSVCASAITLNAGATNCDGKGIIQSHALDPGGANSYNPADTSAGTLRPTPGPERGIHGWAPVTRRYGCEAISCTPTGTNYVAALKSAYGGTTIPTSVYLGTTPYPNLSTSFTDISVTVCPGVTTALPAFIPGNYYVNCDLNITKAAAKLIFEGGTIVVNGGLNLTAGCLAVNAASCSTTFTAPTNAAEITTIPAPTSDAMLYLRGDSFFDRDTLIMPQTFVYQAAAAKSLSISTTSPTLWTAPGAGAVTSGQSTLERQCYVASPSPGAVDQACLDSRFSRIAYWSEYAAPQTKPDDFNGQGQLSLVGVFFAPRAYLNLAGGSGYSAASAQFWADRININGTGTLVLAPDTRTSVNTPVGGVGLIR